MPQEIEALLRSLDDGVDVVVPAQVFGDDGAQELEGVDGLYGLAVYDQWDHRAPLPTEVDHHLLGLGGVQLEVVFAAPRHQAVDLLAVLGLIAFGDATFDHGVVGELHQLNSVMGQNAVVGEQAVEQ